MFIGIWSIWLGVGDYVLCVCLFFSLFCLEWLVERGDVNWVWLEVVGLMVMDGMEYRGFGLGMICS